MKKRDLTRRENLGSLKIIVNTFVVTLTKIGEQLVPPKKI
jgi:hypothetical protein